MTLQGMITRETAEDFGISTATTLQTKTNPEIAKWCQFIDEAISANNSLSERYQFEVCKGCEFIRVNLRTRHNWILIKNLIIINIRQKIPYSNYSSSSNKVKEILIIVDTINQFKDVNKGLADECVNTVVCNFLKDYSYQ
jgi:hypothetical protein